MQDEVQEQPCYFFHDFKLCVRTRELSRDNCPVVIENKVFDCLAYLLQHKDRVISKQELHRALWNERPMSGSVMARNIMKARKAVLDDGKNQFTIKTVPGYGYRFIAPTRCEIQEEKISDLSAGIDEKQLSSNHIYQKVATWAQKKQRIGISVICTVLLFSIVLILFQYHLPIAKKHLQIVVLPIRNNTGDETLNWVELGLMTMINQAFSTQTMINAVSSEHSFKELSNAGLLPVSYLDIFAIARHRLNVPDSYLLFADLHSNKGVFKLSYKIQTPTGNIIRGQLIDEQLMNITHVIGRRVAAQLNIIDSIQSVVHKLPADSQVQKYYLQATIADKNGEIEKAKTYYRRCLELYPKAMWAKYQLALLEAASGGWQQSESLAQQMLTGSTVLADYRYAIAASHVLGELYWRQGNLPIAETHLRNGLELAALNDQHQLSTHLMTSLAIVLRLRGDDKNALSQLQQALTIQRQLSDKVGEASSLQELGRLSYGQGDLRMAENFTRKALNLRRALNHYTAEADSLNEMGRIFVAQGKWGAAEIFFEEALLNSQRSKNWWNEVQASISLANLKQVQGQMRHSLSILQNASQLSEHIEKTELFSAIQLHQLAAQNFLDNEESIVQKLSSSRDNLLSSTNNHIIATEINLKIGRMYLIQNALSEAQLAAQTALASAHEMNNTYLHARALRLQANIAHIQNKLDLADKLYREALVLAESLGFKQLRADIKIDLGYLCMQVKEMSQTKAVIVSLDDLSNYHRLLALDARYNYNTGDFQSAVQLYLRAKLLAGERWTSAEQQLLDTYRAAAKQGKILPLGNVHISFSA